MPDTPTGATAGGGPDPADDEPSITDRVTGAGAAAATVLGRAASALGHAAAAVAGAVTGGASATDDAADGEAPHGDAPHEGEPHEDRRHDGAPHDVSSTVPATDGAAPAPEATAPVADSAPNAPADVTAAATPADAPAPEPTPGPGRATPGSGTLSTAVVEVVAGGFGTASRLALTRLLDALGVEQGSNGADLPVFGEGLRSVARLLGHEPGLRRALTEPSREPAARSKLAHALLDGRVAEPVATIVGDAAADRWSHPRDLVDGLDVTATAAEVAAARSTGDLDSLEDDMFRFERIIDGDPGLRSALADRRAPAASRTALVHRLLDGKASAAAVRLAEAAVADLRGRSVETALTEVQALVAALQDRVVAVVRVAAPLTPAQHTRLADKLSGVVGHAVQLNVIEDATVVGGFVAEIGDTVIDASVANRLAGARRRLVG